jgi:hypothetical protein
LKDFHPLDLIRVGRAEISSVHEKLLDAGSTFAFPQGNKTRKALSRAHYG